MGGRPQAASLVQGLRPRNAPPPKPSLTDRVCAFQQYRSSNVAAANRIRNQIA